MKALRNQHSKLEIEMERINWNCWKSGFCCCFTIEYIEAILQKTEDISWEPEGRSSLKWNFPIKIK